MIEPSISDYNNSDYNLTKMKKEYVILIKFTTSTNDGQTIARIDWTYDSDNSKIQNVNAKIITSNFLQIKALTFTFNYIFIIDSNMTLKAY